MKDILGLMKKAEELQTRMQENMEALDNTLVEGEAGAGLVKITTTARGTLKSVTIDESLLKVEEKEILEDLLVAAHNDAKQKSEKVLAEKMAEVTAGMPLPPGLKLF